MDARSESPKKTEGTERDGASRAEGLPKTLVRRMVKEKLSGDGDINLHKDAFLAFSESVRIFIHYLSVTANDICKESRRQIVNADDVLMAIKDIEFPEFIEPLKASLDGKAKKADASKLEESNKRSLEGESSVAKEGSKKKKKGRKANAAAEIPRKKMPKVNLLPQQFENHWGFCMEL